MALKLAPGSKWILIGDSITDCGRAQPVGEGLFNALGSGYVQMLAGLLGASYPGANLRIVNMGTSGNTVRDLKARWRRDVLDQKPQWLSIMIGINDVWRQFDSPLQTESHVSLEEYGETYEELIAATKSSLEGLVLATPFYIEPNRSDPMRRRMDEYGDVVRHLAAKHGAILIDTQAGFDRVMADIYPAAIAWDRVHPNHVGSAVLAKTFLDGVGFEW
jgi:lysophospholipase L1-like esterase